MKSPYLLLLQAYGWDYNHYKHRTLFAYILSTSIEFVPSKETT